MKYINIFYLSFIAVFGLNSCFTHPSPSPKTTIIQPPLNPKKRIIRNVYTKKKVKSDINKQISDIEDKSIYFSQNSTDFNSRGIKILQGIIDIKIRINSLEIQSNHKCNN